MKFAYLRHVVDFYFCYLTIHLRTWKTTVLCLIKNTTHYYINLSLCTKILLLGSLNYIGCRYL